MKRLVVLLIFALLVLSCKEKIEKVYYESGNIKYFSKNQEEYTSISKYDDKTGELILTAKYKDKQLIDTIHYISEEPAFIKIDSADQKYFYGTYILKYSNKNIGSVSAVRFDKNSNIDSIFISTKVFGLQKFYHADGKIGLTIEHKIVNDSSIIISEKTFY